MTATARRLQSTPMAPYMDVMRSLDVNDMHLVVEFMNTRYQSGPIYHDHNRGLSDHIGGGDNYYNHGPSQGWSNWGQVMGNPLYISPIYNEDGALTINDNRFYAWHFGMSGKLFSNLRYRVLCSWQKGWGTYPDPFLYPQENLSVMGEVTYYLPKPTSLGRVSVTGAVAMDHGGLLGNNVGALISLKTVF